ncbi:MAG TPA: class I lanthipeptide [Myxococcaceae bacterium]|nr:class I lanthipeptide [Myxococcaceae bacterium]
MKKSKKLQFSKESVKVLDDPALNRAVGGFVITTAVSCPNFDDCFRTYDCSVDGVCTTGGLSCLVVCDTP